jgi:hypothetical protein
MNIVSLFVTHAKPSLLKQPRERGFHDPADRAEPATMISVSFGNHRDDAATTQRLADLCFRVIRTICVHRFGTFARAALRAFNRFDGIDQRHGHFRVVDVGPGLFDDQRSAIAIDDQMAFRAVFAAIRGIGARLGPPKMARTEQLSIAAADQSMASAWPSSSRRACQILCQTPATCQSRKRRQQVIPDPAPNSLGRYSQGMPVRNTNRMPVSAFRFGTGGRPPLGFGSGGGKNGATRSHSSSVSSGLAIAVSSTILVLNRLSPCSIRRFC